MSEQLTLWATCSAIFSQGSAAGPLLYEWRDGQTTGLAGLLPFPASPLAAPASVRAPTTSATSGQSAAGSSRTANLQSSLESRLRAKLESRGSPLYELKWKHWAMDSGPPICALRALAHHTHGNGCTGWPTLIKRDGATLLRARRAPNATGTEPMAWVGGLVIGIVTENRAGLKMEAPVGLNPVWASWLMGFPEEWPQSAPSEMQSYLSWRPSS